MEVPKKIRRTHELVTCFTPTILPSASLAELRVAQNPFPKLDAQFQPAKQTKRPLGGRSNVGDRCPKTEHELQRAETMFQQEASNLGNPQFLDSTCIIWEVYNCKKS